MVDTISPAALAEIRRRGEPFDLLDVRTPAEYGEAHVDGARNVSLDRLDAKAIVAERAGRPGTLYVVCKSGGRSRQACEKLLASGLTAVASVEGGTAACEAAGLRLIRGRKAMSLERQVRICAGALVVLGVALAWFTQIQAWTLLSGFIGAGLVFAGVTDTCGMAMMLAKMPWNQAPRGASCSTALMALALLSLAGEGIAAEHTKDSLDLVKQSTAAGKAILVDVREEEEWVEGHVVGAKLLPLSSLEKGIPADELTKALAKGKIVYVHCQAGGRCKEAVDILAKSGYDVRALKPGFPSLEKAGFPTATGK
jgi:rhodanese-related sulfurtransferase